MQNEIKSIIDCLANNTASKAGGVAWNESMLEMLSQKDKSHSEMNENVIKYKTYW